MTRLVEDAGKPIYAGWLSRVYRLTGRTRGTRWVGARRVRWFIGRKVATVPHRPADPDGDPLQYPVTIDVTPLPSGGRRWWWLCPACQKRVDVLDLPRDRDRLGCRGCLGLSYRSQHTRKKLRRRTRRPVVEGDNLIGRWVWLAPWRRR